MLQIEMKEITLSSEGMHCLDDKATSLNIVSHDQCAYTLLFKHYAYFIIGIGSLELSA